MMAINGFWTMLLCIFKSAYTHSLVVCIIIGFGIVAIYTEGHVSYAISQESERGEDESRERR